MVVLPDELGTSPAHSLILAVSAAVISELGAELLHTAVCPVSLTSL